MANDNNIGDFVLIIVQLTTYFLAMLIGVIDLSFFLIGVTLVLILIELMVANHNPSRRRRK